MGQAKQIETLTKTQIDHLMALYEKEWWTKGRSKEAVLRMLDTVNVVVAFADADTDELIAFACVMTDGAFRALLMDVIVREDQRGTGLGRTLMDAVLSHPAVKGTKRLDLYCLPEMVPFYEMFGFSHFELDIQLMQRPMTSD